MLLDWTSVHFKTFPNLELRVLAYIVFGSDKNVDADRDVDIFDIILMASAYGSSFGDANYLSNLIWIIKEPSISSILL